MRFRFSRRASAFLPVWGTGGMLGSTPDTFICLRFSIFCWAVAAIGSASTNEEANSPIRNDLDLCIRILLDESKEPKSLPQRAGVSRVPRFFLSPKIPKTLSECQHTRARLH